MAASAGVPVAAAGADHILQSHWSDVQHLPQTDLG